ALHGRLALTLAPLILLALASLAALTFGRAPRLTAVVELGWTLVAAVLAILAALVIGVRLAERRQRFTAARPSDEQLRAIAATQLQPVTNEMTIAGPLKEGAWRPLVLRIALWIVARVAPLITIPTVASARWLAIDGGRRLVFLSIFEKLSEPYVRDFIDIPSGAQRINLLFGFGRGYPATRWILGGGALDDPHAFVHVVASGQQITELWYCPYRNLTIDNIKINRQIRQGLYADLSDAQVRDWLQLL
ncbi:MAG: hypothetical protein H7138_26700, partial [Myxococcales bacterium]|nr:hypothetical protein [Myxococcales bacterium]